jgi:signal transduction protein with GAF and PtsI domain
LFSYLGVPLIAQDKVLGIFFYCRQERYFSDEEINFLHSPAPPVPSKTLSSTNRPKSRLSTLKKPTKSKTNFGSYVPRAPYPLNVIAG